LTRSSLRSYKFRTGGTVSNASKSCKIMAMTDGEGAPFAARAESALKLENVF
jgi:hypothetical protein